MTEPLLHLISPGDWRAALAAGAVAPPSLHEAGFVHLSTAAQVALPAGRLFHGRRDLALLVLDPDRLDVPIEWEPGVPGDPGSMRFPHAYGPLPTTAVLGVLPYRPRADGGFDAPTVPVLDPAGRCALAAPSLLRRVATSEVPVTGGVVVLTGPVPGSRQHNQLVVDGTVDAATLVADADRVLGGAGLPHRMALLSGGHLAPTAAGLAARGWEVEELTIMAAGHRGARDPAVGRAEVADLRPFWDAAWRGTTPGVDDVTLRHLTDRYELEDARVDLRVLAVRDDGEVVACCLLKIDGGTAMIDAVETRPDHRARGHGNALLRQALALAGRAGCDLVTLEATTADWPRHWYGRHGFEEVARAWSARPSERSAAP